MRGKSRISGISQINKEMRFFLCFLVLACLGYTLPGAGQAGDFPVLKGPYLGQKPPGMKPELFAPGIICTERYEGSSAFTKDGKTFIFRRSGIYMMREVNGRWTKPEQQSFHGYHSVVDFTLGPDGKTLYFASSGPVKEGAPAGNGNNLWKAEMTGDGWSEPLPLGSLFNTGKHESYPSLAANGTLYFFRRVSQERSDIYLSRRVNGKYTEPVNLGAPVNTKFHEWDAYVALDESYLVICSTKPSGYGKDDLYISYSKKDGSWTTPIHMGAEFNSPGWENRPYVTMDGKYFFFTSTKKPPKGAGAGNAGSNDIYWVDARILMKFKAEAFK